MLLERCMTVSEDSTADAVGVVVAAWLNKSPATPELESYLANLLQQLG